MREDFVALSFTIGDAKKRVRRLMRQASGLPGAGNLYRQLSMMSDALDIVDRMYVLSHEMVERLPAAAQEGTAHVQESDRGNTGGADATSQNVRGDDVPPGTPDRG